jgi:hypothetical protein
MSSVINLVGRDVKSINIVLNSSGHDGILNGQGEITRTPLDNDTSVTMEYIPYIPHILSECRSSSKLTLRNINRGRLSLKKGTV